MCARVALGRAGGRLGWIGRACATWGHSHARARARVRERVCVLCERACARSERVCVCARACMCVPLYVPVYVLVYVCAVRRACASAWGRSRVSATHLEDTRHAPPAEIKAALAAVQKKPDRYQIQRAKERLASSAGWHARKLPDADISTLGVPAGACDHHAHAVTRFPLLSPTEHARAQRNQPRTRALMGHSEGIRRGTRWGTSDGRYYAPAFREGLSVTDGRPVRTAAAIPMAKRKQGTVERRSSGTAQMSSRVRVSKLGMPGCGGKCQPTKSDLTLKRSDNICDGHSVPRSVPEQWQSSASVIDKDLARHREPTRGKQRNNVRAALCVLLHTLRDSRAHGIP
jgi:hypothetical protein